MKAGRFSESQIVAILKQQDSGQTVAQISREHGISEATFYTWKAKYGGIQVSEVKRLKDIEGVLLVTGQRITLSVLDLYPVPI